MNLGESACWIVARFGSDRADGAGYVYSLLSDRYLSGVLRPARSKTTEFHQLVFAAVASYAGAVVPQFASSQLWNINIAQIAGVESRRPAK